MHTQPLLYGGQLNWNFVNNNNNYYISFNTSSITILNVILISLYLFICSRP